MKLRLARVVRDKILESQTTVTMRFYEGRAVNTNKRSDLKIFWRPKGWQRTHF